MERPDCYKCVHRRNLIGNAHSRCNNLNAHISANPHGVKKGWFMWPINFDPHWLIACDGFSDNPEDNKPDQKLHPLAELLGMLSR